MLCWCASTGRLRLDIGRPPLRRCRMTSGSIPDDETSRRGENRVAARMPYGAKQPNDGYAMIRSCGRRICVPEATHNFVFALTKGAVVFSKPAPVQPLCFDMNGEVFVIDAFGPLRRRPQGGAFSRLGRQLNVHEVQRMGQPSPQGPAGPHQGPVSAKDQPRPGGGPHGIGPPGGAPGARMPVKRERPDREQPEDVDADEGPPRKVGLLSSIGASSFTVKGKSRSELLSEQSGDQNVKARNRRMFGMILGTLKSFEKEESTKRKEQVDKKVEKEQKVEEQKEREKEEAVRQRRELIEEKRDKQIKLRQLQAKMEVVGAFEEFSKRHGYMANFIHTAAKPPLMWLPRVHTPASEDSLARSRAKIEAIVAKEQQRVELELERIEGVHRDSDGEADGKENNSGSTMPSSVAVVVNNDHKDVAEADSKQNGSTDKTPAQEKTAVDPLMKNIKIIIENDLAVKKGVNGKRENADDDEVDEEAATGDEVDEVEPRQETLEEELQQEPRRHDTESKDDESDHEDEVTIRSKDEEDDPKDENAERG
ncbi:hypothetical protein BIW11_03913, partial [Tropilaelaps mercedesae]